jgi:hypothetical protein
MGSNLKRFHDKVDTSGDCHEWTAYSGPNGYGLIKFNNKVQYAHRVAAHLAGLLPSLDSKLNVCHKCDNPKCVNPDHLFLGTQVENIKDMVSKNRNKPASGEVNGRSKLTEADIPVIRKDPRSLRTIAKDYNVTQTQIFNVKHRKTWAHVA